MLYQELRSSLPSGILLPANTPKTRSKAGAALPAANILGSDGSEHAEGGFHGICGAIVIESPIALQPGVAEAAAHPPKLVLRIMSVIQTI